MFDQTADAAAKNARLAEAIRAGKENRGYVTTGQGGTKIHAAAGIIKGHGGYNHPRSFCQPHTPRTYAHVMPNEATHTVTCQRCLASMAKKGL